MLLTAQIILKLSSILIKLPLLDLLSLSRSSAGQCLKGANIIHQRRLLPIRPVNLSNSTIGLIDLRQEKLWKILMSSYYADFTQLTRMSSTLQELRLLSVHNKRSSAMNIRIKPRTIRLLRTLETFLSKIPSI